MNSFKIHDIVNLGDVNGDEIEDLGISSLPQRTGSKRTHAIVFGSQQFDSGFDLVKINGQNGVFLSCAKCAAQAKSGVDLTISAIGDVNGDGKHDVMVVARSDSESADQMATPSNEYFVVYGDALRNGIDPSAIDDKSLGFTLRGFDAVFPVGDINGDGKDDLGFFRAPVHSVMQQSKPYVGAVFGSKNFGKSFDYFNDFKPFVNGFALEFWCLECKKHKWQGGDAVGDMNGDGLGDMVVTLTTTKRPAGYNIVIFGKRNAKDFPTSELRIDGSNGFMLLETNCMALSCRAKVMAGGDINGDGLGDLLGVDSNYGTPRNPERGRASVLFGSRKPFKITETWADANGHNGYMILYEDVTKRTKFGSDATSVGDINSDGYDDFAVTQFGGDSTYAAFVFLGGRGRQPFVYVDDCDGSQCFSLHYSTNKTEAVHFASAVEHFKRFRGHRPNASAMAVLRLEDQGSVDFVRLSSLELHPSGSTTANPSSQLPWWRKPWFIGGAGIVLGLLLASVGFLVVVIVTRCRQRDSSNTQELSAPMLPKPEPRPQSPSKYEPILYNARGRRTSSARDLYFAQEDEEDDLDEYLS